MTNLLFSSRFDWEIGTNPLGRLLAAKQGEGRTIYDLTVSNPTGLGFDYPTADILSALSSEASMDYHPDPHGLIEAREAVAAYYAQSGHPIGLDQLFLTANTSEAYGVIFKLLADPGDEILVPSPGYPLLAYLASFESLQPVTYPLRYDDRKGWSLDLDLLDALVTDKTRAIVAVSPNNPTGSYVGQDELRTLDEICCRHGLALIVDEVFSDYKADDSMPTPCSAFNRTHCLTFVLNGLSKMLALPQVKLGWIAVCGEPAPVAGAVHGLEILLDFYLSVSTPVQHALARLMTLRPMIQRQITERLRRNEQQLRQWVADGAAGPAHIQVLNREGGWYAVVAFSDAVSDETRVLQLLEKSDTLVHPGYFYEFGKEGFVVLSLLPQPEVFQTGIERLLGRPLTRRF